MGVCEMGGKPSFPVTEGGSVCGCPGATGNIDGGRCGDCDGVGNCGVREGKLGM